MAEVPAVPGSGGNVKFFAEGFIGDPTTTIIREAADPTTGEKTEEKEIINVADILGILKKIDAVLKHRASRSPLKGRLPKGLDPTGDAKLLGGPDDELRALSEKLTSVHRGNEWWKRDAPDVLKQLAED